MGVATLDDELLCCVEDGVDLLLFKNELHGLKLLGLTLGARYIHTHIRTYDTVDAYHHNSIFRLANLKTW